MMTVAAMAAVQGQDLDGCLAEDRRTVVRHRLTWAKTADYADGPGKVARACVRLGSGRTVCSGAMSLRASSARDTGAAVPVSYVRRQVSSTGSVFCTGWLSSTITGKTATSYVDAYVGDFSSAAACTGVLES
jgi:hypothetical protein